MIRYLNNAANEIEYTNKDGHTVTRNPFDGEFVYISQRLSLQHSNDAENQQRRHNYEQAISNAQISADNGRPYTVPPVPRCIVTPEDFREPEYETETWTPPLLTLKPAPKSTMVPIGPDSPARPQSSHLDTALTLLATLGPQLPAFLALLQSLLAHHETTQPAAQILD